MADLNIDVNKPDMQRLNSVLHALVKNTGRTCYQSVMFATVRCAESMRASSTPAPNYRKVLNNPAYTAKGRKRIPVSEWVKSGIGYKFMVKFDFRKDKPFWFTNDKTDPKRVIAKRGLARRMWNIVAAKAASATTASENAGNLNWKQEQASLRVFTGEAFTSATQINELSYLVDAYGPGQVPAAVASATRKLEHDAWAGTEANCRKANAA